MKNLIDKFKNLIKKIRAQYQVKLALKNAKFRAIFPFEQNIIIYLPKGYPGQSFEMTWRAQKEPVKRIVCTTIINNIIGQGGVFVDVGCYIGDNSLAWASMLLDKGGTVIACDPALENVNFIQECKKINSINNLVVKKQLISDDNGRYKPLEALKHSEFVEMENNDKSDNYVESLLIDNILQDAEYSDRKLTFLHIDVEGMEFKVLKGSTKVIQKWKPIIVWEVHLKNHNNNLEIQNYLNQYGYECYLINEVIAGNRPDCRNYIAFNPSQEKNIIEALRRINVNDVHTGFPVVYGPVIIPLKELPGNYC